MGEGGNLRFGLGPIEQELQPEISREAWVRGGHRLLGRHGPGQRQSHAGDDRYGRARPHAGR
jgi:hypothetical protein